MSKVVRFPGTRRRREQEGYEGGFHVRADTLAYSALYQGIVKGRHRVARDLLECLQGENLGQSVIPLPDLLQPYVSHLVSEEVTKKMASDWDSWAEGHNMRSLPDDHEQL